MQMSDTRQIAATPEQVYVALLDADTLLACVPGATQVAGSAEEGFIATVVQKVGPVKATFKGDVNLTDLVPNTSMRIEGAGKGGAAGFAKGGATVQLAAHEGGCTLSYDVDAKVGGKLAQLGSRIIDGFAKKMAEQFFSNLQEHLEGPVEPAAEAPEAKKGWFGRDKS